MKLSVLSVKRYAMVNTLRQESGNTSSSKAVKSILVTGTALLFLLKPGVSKGSDEVRGEVYSILKQHPENEYVIQADQSEDQGAPAERNPDLMQGGNDALAYATANVSKYYPDMKAHLATMINSFRDEEHKSATLAMLNKMVANISDPEQKTGAVIYALEGLFRKEQPFSLKYDSKITDTTFKYIETFDDEYKERFKQYYARLEANLERIENKNKALETNLERIENKNKALEANLKEGLQHIESIMDKFTPDDVRTSEHIRKLVTDTKNLFISSDYTYSAHTKTLFEALR